MKKKSDWCRPWDTHIDRKELFDRKNYVIVPVVCMEQDFIAAGSDLLEDSISSVRKTKQAVFTKVRLRREDYRKAKVN